MENKMNKPSVCILGGGNGACAYATDLKIKGSRVSLFELPEFFSNLEPAVEAGGMWLENRNQMSGVSEGFAPIDVITCDPKEAVEGAEIIFLVVPSFGQKAFMKAVAPYLTDGQIIAICPCNFGAAFAMKNELKAANNESDVIIVEAECMMYSGFKDDSTHVWVSGYKNGMCAAAYPAIRTDEAFEKISQVYPEWVKAPSVLDTSLRNLNMVFHAPITVCNASLVDRSQEFQFYWQGCSTGVGQVVETVEAERQAVGKALGLQLTPALEVLKEWYGNLGCKGDTLTEAVSTNPVYEWDMGPATLQHRFLLEDIPYGMIPLETLGKQYGVPTPTISAVIQLGIVLTGKNLRAQARDMYALGLDKVSKEDLIKMVMNG